MSCESSPSWATQPLHAVGEPAVLRIEVLLELAFDLLLDGLLVLIERFLQAADEAVAFAAEGVGADLAADVPQREDADLERFDGVLVALVALGVFDERADHFAVVDRQLQRQLERQVAVRFAVAAPVDARRRFAGPWRT